MSQKIHWMVRLGGTKSEHYENMLVTLAMLAVTLTYEGFSWYLIPDFQFNSFEFIGTWSGLITVWLARTQNILSWPWGIVSAASLGYFFMQIGLSGQQWLNWGYFMAMQIWAWPYWAFGGKGKTVLPVTRLSARGWVLMICALLLGTWLVYTAISLIAPTSHFPILDSVVVASSIVAQLLLGQKKLESWYLWLGPVNVLSVILFVLAGAYVVLALYVAFLVHAFFAIHSWRRELLLTRL
jgi:nicotinamide mononucleotide transporter